MNETITIGERTFELPFFGPLPEPVYRPLPAFGYSDTKRMIESPGAYMHGGVTCDQYVLDKGTAWHTFATETDAEINRLIALDPWDTENHKEASRNSNMYKDALAAHKEATDELGVMIKRKDRDAMIAMRNQLHRYGPTQHWWEHRWLVEWCIVWRDEATGVLCKARIDLMPALEAVRNTDDRWARLPAALDLKSKAGATDRNSFAKHALSLGYDIQAVHYAEGLRAIGRDCCDDEFQFMVVSREPPHAVGLYWFGEVELLDARARRHDALELYKACELSGQWPGDHEPGPLHAPPWERKNRVIAYERMTDYRRQVDAEYAEQDEAYETGEGVDW